MVDGFRLLADLIAKKSKENSERCVASYGGTDEQGVPWVYFPGNDVQTPIIGQVSSELKVGDEVEVLVKNGRASIVSNQTAPSVGSQYVHESVEPIAEAVSEVDEKAEQANEAAAIASKSASSANDIARNAVERADAVAEAIDQHFFTDTNGVHVSTDENNPTGTRNILINSLGMILRSASTYLAQFTSGEVAFYDGLGNAAANIVALFGSSGARIGKQSESHVDIDAQNVKVMGGNSTMISLGPEQWSSGEPTGGGIIRFNASTNQYVAGDANGHMIISSGDRVVAYSGNRASTTAGANRNATLELMKPINVPGNNDTAFRVTKETVETSGVSILNLTYGGDLELAGTISRSSIPALGDLYVKRAYGSYYNNTSLSLSTSAQKLALSNYSGTGTSASSNGIKVAEAGVYLVVGTCYCTTGFTANDVFHLDIYQNISSVMSAVSRMITASPYQTVTATAIVSCAADDVLYLYAFNQTGSRGTVASRDKHGLTVVRVA